MQNAERNTLPANENAPRRSAICVPADPALQKRVESSVTASEIGDAMPFPEKDVNDLNWQVLEGRFDRVIFGDLNTLLQALWNEDADLQAWINRGIRIEYFDSGSESVPNGIPVQMTEVLASIIKHHADWSLRSQRRRRTAGIILSAVGLFAMLTFFLTF